MSGQIIIYKSSNLQEGLGAEYYCYSNSDGTYGAIGPKGKHFAEYVEACSQAKFYADSMTSYFKKAGNSLVPKNNLSQAERLMYAVANVYNQNCAKPYSLTKDYSANYKFKKPKVFGIYKTKEDFFSNNFYEIPDVDLKKVEVVNISSKNSKIRVNKKTEIDFSSSEYFGFYFNGYLYFYDKKSKELMFYRGGKKLILAEKFFRLISEDDSRPAEELKYDKEMYYDRYAYDSSLVYFFDEDFNQVSDYNCEEIIKKHPNLYEVFKRNKGFSKVINRELGY